MIEAAFVSLLNSIAGVIALVSDRIYPIQAPQTAALPTIEYQVVSGLHSYGHDGPAGYATPLMQVTITGKTYLEALQVRDALRAGVSGYKGVIGGVQIYSIFIANEYQESTNLDTGLCTVREDYRISYKE